MSGVQILPSPLCMMKICFVCVGKLKNKQVTTLFAEYIGRLKHYTKVQCIEIKDSNMREEGKLLLKKSENTFRVLLSEDGRERTSNSFASFLKNLTKDTSFIIGGPEGVSDEVKKNADEVLSLSSMTFPYELARVFLAEQIYRSFTILNKMSYHK